MAFFGLIHCCCSSHQWNCGLSKSLHHSPDSWNVGAHSNVAEPAVIREWHWDTTVERKPDGKLDWCAKRCLTSIDKSNAQTQNAFRTSRKKWIQKIIAMSYCYPTNICFWHCCIGYHTLDCVSGQSVRNIRYDQQFGIEHEGLWSVCSLFLSICLTRSSSQSQGELIYQYLWHLFFSLSPLSWEWRGQRGEAQAPVKWLYRGETRAGRGPRLKAEWQAAEAIKIEPLSLAARALLIQTGAQATRTHIHSHTHTFYPVVLELTCGDMDVDMCVFIYTYKLLFLSVSVGLSGVCSTSRTHQSVPRQDDCTDKWAGGQVDTKRQTNKQLSLPILPSKCGCVRNVKESAHQIHSRYKDTNPNWINIEFRHYSRWIVLISCLDSKRRQTKQWVHLCWRVWIYFQCNLRFCFYMLILNLQTCKAFLNTVIACLHVIGCAW